MDEIIQGLPPELAGPAEEMQGALSEAKQCLKEVGETEVELAGPETQEETTVPGDSVGAPPRRIRYPFRKGHRTAVKRASSAPPSSGGSDLAARVNNAEQSVSRLSTAWGRFLTSAKSKMRKAAFVKGSAVGNRAIFTATALNVGAGIAGAITAVVGNADIEYDRVAFIANTPGIFTALTAAGNAILEGSGSIPVDAGVLAGPFELSEPLKLNGNGGVNATFTNRGAVAGDGTILFIPKGHVFGSAMPMAA